MFNHNPFSLILDFFADKAQRFSLYMLDNHNVLVSTWALMLSFTVTITSFVIGRLIGTNLADAVFDYFFLVSNTFCFIVPALFQFSCERKRKFITYNILRTGFEQNQYLQYIVVISVFIFTYFIINKYFTTYDRLVLCIRLVHGFSWFSFYIFMRCYTRDRDPPFKGQVALSM